MALALLLPIGILYHMGIRDRLENVIKSYLNDDTEKVFRKSSQTRYSDPDLNAAYEELNDYLGGGDGRKKPGDSSTEKKTEKETAGKQKRPVPEELKKDFAELGLSPDAQADECKSAYKKLLKLHHPDRHSGDPEKIKKATEKTARVNAAYDHLERWFRIST